MAVGVLVLKDKSRWQLENVVKNSISIASELIKSCIMEEWVKHSEVHQNVSFRPLRVPGTGAGGYTVYLLVIGVGFSLFSKVALLTVPRNSPPNDSSVIIL